MARAPWRAFIRFSASLLPREEAC
jgi:hypothetical protein